MFIVPFDQNGEIDYQNMKFINGTMEECTEKDFAGLHDDHSKYLFSLSADQNTASQTRKNLIG